MLRRLRAVASAFPNTVLYTVLYHCCYITNYFHRDDGQGMPVLRWAVLRWAVLRWTGCATVAALSACCTRPRPCLIHQTLVGGLGGTSAAHHTPALGP